MMSSAAMSRLWFLGALVCLASGSAWHHGAASEPLPRPDTGMVVDGAYTNKYFDLSYRLLPEWTEGLEGPEPSHSGYYVLKSLIPSGEFTGMILVAAQDQFFAPKAFATATDVAADLSRAKSEIEGMSIDRQPSEVTIAGRSFSRVDISGFGLFDRTFITQSRCHLVSFNFTANSADRLTELVRSMEKVTSGGQTHPTCIRNYAKPENVVTRVNPLPIAPLATPIPVRIIVASDGSVKHVHAIRATDDQRTGIENALRQWKLKPYVVDGRAVEVETGVIIQFGPDGSVRYPTGDRQPPG